MSGKGQPEEKLEVLERLLRRFSSFMHGDANRTITKEAMKVMMTGQMHLKESRGSRILVDRLVRTEKSCIL